MRRLGRSSGPRSTLPKTRTGPSVWKSSRRSPASAPSACLRRSESTADIRRLNSSPECAQNTGPLSDRSCPAARSLSAGSHAEREGNTRRARADLRQTGVAVRRKRRHGGRDPQLPSATLTHTGLGYSKYGADMSGRYPETGVSLQTFPIRGRGEATFRGVSAA
jgi:hypothetical protein